MIISLELPWPPSVNDYWRSKVIPGKSFPMVYTTATAKAYRTKVNQIWNASNYESLQNRRLSVRVSIHPPTRRKIDLDNRMKAILDAMTHTGVWDDDEQIDELHIRRGEIVPDGCVIVEVTELKTSETGGGA